MHRNGLPVSRYTLEMTYCRNLLYIYLSYWHTNIGIALYIVLKYVILKYAIKLSRNYNEKLQLFLLNIFVCSQELYCT